MLYQMRLLPERFAAHLAPERFLARVRSQVHLYVALIEESSVTNGTSVHRLLLAPYQPRLGPVG